MRGFTSQRVTDSDGNLQGFRLAPADAPLSVIGEPSAMDDVFKWFTPHGARVDMRVFETTGVRFMEEALADAKAGIAQMILLDEIGGHELASELFYDKLYELLDSEYPCVGVIKSPENTRRMNPALLQLNAALHEKVSVVPICDLAQFI